MNINTITAEDLRRMPDKEGLILQGCGGDLTEGVDGINEMLTKAYFQMVSVMTSLRELRMVILTS